MGFAKLNADTISVREIRQLRHEALAAGDLMQADYCDIALAPHEDRNEDGGPLVWPWSGAPATRTNARARCAEAINTARAAAGTLVIITVRTVIQRPRPSTCGVRGGIDYEAELHVTDESGETYQWTGEVTYAPNTSGELVPYAGSPETWLSDPLMRAIRTRWIAAHKSLVEFILNMLGGGTGDYTGTITL